MIFGATAQTMLFNFVACCITFALQYIHADAQHLYRRFKNAF